VSKIACNILVIIFLNRFPTKVFSFSATGIALGYQRPLIVLVSGKKNKMAEHKMAGASPWNLKM